MYSWLEINSKAIAFNLRQLKKLIGKEVRLMPVIKANAYGHGFLEVARICHKMPEIDRLCVVNDEEALLLINNKINVKIQILSYFDEKNNKKSLILAKNNVIFPIFSLKQANFLNKIGESINKNIKVHIKIDTGASRVGLMPNEILSFISSVTSKYSRIKIDGIYSHFAASEEDKIFTNHQLKKFDNLIKKLEQKGYRIPIKHFACSSAAVLYPKSRYQAVRVGLSMYGLYPEELSRKKIKLIPAMSWYARIIQIKTVPAWTKIGYGGSYTTKKKTKLAILSNGYYEGYDRRLSNNSYVLIKGFKCPVRGRICMNIMIVELPANLKVEAGDKATLIGRDKSKVISIDSLARQCGTINYEIADRINPLLPRIII